MRLARDREQNRLARFVLDQMLGNWDIATADRRPMCADTGLPRYYVRLGNEAVVEGGLVALERALRQGDRGGHPGDSRSAPIASTRSPARTATTTWACTPPRSPSRWSRDADWIDVTTVHKGGLFGSD